MTGLRCLTRRFGVAIGFASALLLLGTVWIVGTHHHDAPDRGCVVCTTAHAAAVVGHAVATVSAPRPVATGVLESITSQPAKLAIGIAPSRAPPFLQRQPATIT